MWIGIAVRWVVLGLWLGCGLQVWWFGLISIVSGWISGWGGFGRALGFPVG